MQIYLSRKLLGHYKLDGIHLDKVFTDKASGKDTNRPSMGRLARNVEDMLRLVREMSDC